MISTIGLNIKALKKEPFSGSHHGMRYYLRTEGDTLSAFLYPEPWSFERTPEEEKEKKTFRLPRKDWNPPSTGSTSLTRQNVLSGNRKPKTA